MDLVYDLLLQQVAAEDRAEMAKSLLRPQPWMTHTRFRKHPGQSEEAKRQRAEQMRKLMEGG